MSKQPTIESLKADMRSAEEAWMNANSEARLAQELAKKAFNKFQMAQLSLNTALECMLALAKSEGQV